MTAGVFRQSTPEWLTALVLAGLLLGVFLKDVVGETGVSAGELAVAVLALALVARLLLLARRRRLETERLLALHARERSTRDRFMAEVVDARERSAREVAELLHDDAVQQLTALGLHLELAAEQEGSDRLHDLAGLAGEVTRSLRRLVVELHPSVLESQGLSAAVESSAEALRERGIAVAVSALERRLPRETELVAYRLVQESLLNVLRHAGASRVDVELDVDGGVLACRVADDGAGFDTRSLREAVRDGRLGLHLLRERIEMAGGTHRVESEPGRGTTVTFALPLPLPATRGTAGAGAVR